MVHGLQNSQVTFTFNLTKSKLLKKKKPQNYTQKSTSIWLEAATYLHPAYTDINTPMPMTGEPTVQTLDHQTSFINSKQSLSEAGLTAAQEKRGWV